MTTGIIVMQAGYHSTNHHSTFVLDLASYEVDYIQHRLFNIFKGLFEIRRLAFCPLMPMKVCTLLYIHE